MANDMADFVADVTDAGGLSMAHRSLADGVKVKRSTCSIITNNV
jgi:hypothetical protein